MREKKAFAFKTWPRTGGKGGDKRRGGLQGGRWVAGYMVSEQRFSLNDFYCSFVVNLLCN